MKCWTWFYRNETHLEKAHNYLKKGLTTRRTQLDDLYTLMGHIEGVIGPPMLGLLIHTLATEKKLQDEPEAHKREIFLLALEGLLLVSVTTTASLDLLQRCVKKVSIDFNWWYSMLGRIEGSIGYPMLYLLIDTLMGEEKEVLQNPGQHGKELSLLIIEAILLVCATGVFTAENLYKLHQRCVAGKKRIIEEGDELPPDIREAVNNALREYNDAKSYQVAVPEINNYRDLRQWSLILKVNNHADLSGIIDRYLKEIEFAKERCEETPLLK